MVIAVMALRLEDDDDNPNYLAVNKIDDGIVINTIEKGTKGDCAVGQTA